MRGHNKQPCSDRRSRFLCLLLRSSLFLAVLFPGSWEASADPVHSAGTGAQNSLIILPWYGVSQHFGSPGPAQRWVNILGEVQPHAAVRSLTYSLNRGPESQLNLGPDSRRLSRPGDFNVEIAAARLQEGVNIVRLAAQLQDGKQSRLDIAVRYLPRKWPLPYRVEWQSVQDIQQAIQVVDGLWRLTDKGLRTAQEEIGYDRSFAIGDPGWSSCEIFFPLTVHRIDTDAFARPESARPGFGIIAHWQGHTDTPVDCGQPHCGWLPAGAQIWHFFSNTGADGLNIITKPLPMQPAAVPYRIIPGVTYFLRARVEIRPFRSVYSLKFWRQGEAEPQEWTLQRSAGSKNPDRGSFLIVAHHVDMTVGDIEIHPVPVAQAASPGGAPFSLSSLREYLIPLPFLLALAAGGSIVLYAARQGNIFAQKIPAALGIATVGLLAIVLAEPLFPDILIRNALNARWTAALYLGLDLGRLSLQAVIWLLAVLFFLRAKRRRKI